MKIVERHVELKSGEQILLREPKLEKDHNRLLAFLSGLPEAERGFLRYDVTEGGILKGRLSQLDGEAHFRLLAEVNGQIVGDATLDREVLGWTRHVAQIRGVVAPDYREKGLGTILFRELTIVAEEVGIERLFAEVMGENTAVIATLKQAGFAHEATLKKFAKDIRGNVHDMIIMTNDLTLVWKHLEDQMLLMDIRMPG